MVPPSCPLNLATRRPKMRFRVLGLLWCLLLLIYAPVRAQSAPALEYYDSTSNDYFVTTAPAEIAALDSGAYGPRWQRTGGKFFVWTEPVDGAVPVCRFVSNTPGRTSHVFTPYAAECALLQSDPAWLYESAPFYASLPDALGGCQAGQTPMYRLYTSTTAGPSHRYTTDTAIFASMVARGWTYEGDGNTAAFACVPVTGPSVAYPVVPVALSADAPPATGWIMPPSVQPPAQPLQPGDPVVLHGNPGGTNWYFVNAQEQWAWKTPGGDVKQKLADAHIPGQSRIGIDISGTTSGAYLVVTKGLLNKDPNPGGNQYVGDARIDGQSVPFWQLNPSTNGVIAVSPTGSGPWLAAPLVIVGRGTQLSLYNPRTWAADFEVYEIDVPKVADWPLVQSGLGAAVSKDVDLRNAPGVINYIAYADYPSAYQEAGGQGNVAPPLGYGDMPDGTAEFINGPNGLPIMRFSSLPVGAMWDGKVSPGNQRLVAAFLYPPPLRELWVRYVIAVESDVRTSHGFNELGMKLPGFRGPWVSARNEHRPPDYMNPGIYGLGGTWCFPLDGVDDPREADCAKFQTFDGSPMLVEGRYYVLTQHMVLNTFAADGTPNRDGLFEAFVNGNKVYSTPHRIYKVPADLENRNTFFHLNVYHGGMGVPLAKFHYRLGATVISTTDPGMPPELIGADLRF